MPLTGKGPVTIEIEQLGGETNHAGHDRCVDVGMQEEHPSDNAIDSAPFHSAHCGHP